MTSLLSAAMLVGVITTYAGPYVGQPLYCDRGESLTYRDDIAFVALPVTEYESGRARCGDWVRVTSLGHSFWARSLDAGPLEKYHIEQFGRLPIVADVLAHLWQWRQRFQQRGACLMSRLLTGRLVIVRWDT